MAEATWSVGKVAARAGVAVSALHFYEQKGLIRSWRNQGNQRRFKPDVLRRIAIIKAAQQVGISLEEVKQVFIALPDNRTPTTEDWAIMSAGWKALLDARITYLQRLSDHLTGCIGCGCLSMTKCPLYNPEDKLAGQGSGAVILNQSTQPAEDLL